MSYLSKRCLKADLAIIERRHEVSFLKLAKLIIAASYFSAWYNVCSICYHFNENLVFPLAMFKEKTCINVMASTLLHVIIIGLHVCMYVHCYTESSRVFA